MLDASTGHGKRPEIGCGFVQRTAEAIELLVPEAYARPLDLEAVVPDIRQPRHVDQAGEISERSPRYDRDVQARRRRRLAEQLARVLGEHRGRRIVHQGRERSVVVEEQGHRLAVAQPARECPLDALRRGEHADARRSARDVRRRQETVHPGVHVVRSHPVPENGHARPALVGGHRQGHGERVRHGLDVERIDEQGFLQLFGRAGHLRQDQHAVVVELRRHVLLGDEIHAVAQRCHQRDVGQPVQRDQLFGGKGAH